MPHITLQHSSNIIGIDYISIFRKIHKELSIITDIETCKSRVQKLENCYIGYGEPQNFIIHLVIELLPHPSRTDAVKQQLGEKIVAILEEAFAPSLEALKLEGGPTVEIRTLEKYFVAKSVKA